MAYQSHAVCSGAVEFGERMFMDEVGNDVEIQVRDATDPLKVHTSILCNISEPFRAMLRNDMQERRTKIIKLH